MKKITALLVLLCFSCNVKEEFKTITVKNKYSVSIPENLDEATNLNEDASFQYQNLINEYYVIVIDEPKASFHNAIIENAADITPNLEGYYNTITRHLKDNIKNFKLYDVKSTVINSKKAKVFSISGKVEGYDVFYKYAIIEGKSDYYQIMSWTEKSKEAEYSNSMETTINSFKELGNSGDEKLFKK